MQAIREMRRLHAMLERLDVQHREAYERGDWKRMKAVGSVMDGAFAAFHARATHVHLSAIWLALAALAVGVLLR